MLKVMCSDLRASLSIVLARIKKFLLMLVLELTVQSFGNYSCRVEILWGNGQRYKQKADL